MTPLQLLTHVASGRTDRVYDALVELAEDRDLSIEGASAIQWCAYYGDASAVRALLSAGANLRRLGEDLGLNGAAFHGHWQLCAFPLESGADANWTDLETGETPLHSAMTNEDRDRYDLVTRVLLAKGANPNKATIPGKETGAFMRNFRS